MTTSNKKVITKDLPTVWQKALRLFYLLVLTNAVGYIGSTFTNPEALAWYDTLIQSKLTPPDMYFGLVWAILYFCMAIAAFLAWGKTSPRPFVLQLAFNLIWPFAFFYLKSPIGAFVILLIMMYFIVETIREFGRVSKAAGWLMVPVLFWTIFAGYLNLIVVLYNTEIGVWLGLV